MDNYIVPEGWAPEASNYIISTDSNSDLPVNWMQKYDIKCMIMPYAVDGVETVRDPNQDFDSNAFYDAMRANPTADIKTMARNAEEFKEFWRPYLEAGKDVFHLCFSSQLSGTFDNSVMAAKTLSEEFPDRKIFTIDTKQICIQQASSAVECARRRMEGMGIDGLKDWYEENMHRFCVLFSVEDLSYLKRSGRLSSASAAIGSLLSIKPVLRVSPGGRLEAIGKVKGRKKVLRALTEAIANNYTNEGNDLLFIADAGCPDDVELLVQYLHEAGVTVPIQFSHIGPVIGAHVGPGTVAVSYMGKDQSLPEYNAGATE